MAVMTLLPTFLDFLVFLLETLACVSSFVLLHFLVLNVWHFSAVRILTVKMEIGNFKNSFGILIKTVDYSLQTTQNLVWLCLIISFTIFENCFKDMVVIVIVLFRKTLLR